MRHEHGSSFDCSDSCRRDFGGNAYGHSGDVAIEQIVANAEASAELLTGHTAIESFVCGCGRHQMAADLRIHRWRDRWMHPRIYQIQVGTNRSEWCVRQMHRHVFDQQHRHVPFQGDSIEGTGRQHSNSIANGRNDSHLLPRGISIGSGGIDTCCECDVHICWHRFNSCALFKRTKLKNVGLNIDPNGWHRIACVYNFDERQKREKKQLVCTNLM